MSRPRWLRLRAGAVLALLGAATIAIACGGNDDEVDYAEQLVAINQHWVETAEQPLQDFVLRIASDPASMEQRRDEYLIGTSLIQDLSDEALAGIGDLGEPPDGAADCVDAELARVRAVRDWTTRFEEALEGMQYATATSRLGEFQQILSTVVAADDACRAYVEGLD